MCIVFVQIVEFNRRPTRLKKDTASSKGYAYLRRALQNKDSFAETGCPSPLRKDELFDDSD